MVLWPSVMRLVPVNEAESAMTRVGAKETGVLGPAGIVEARLEDMVDHVIWRPLGGEWVMCWV